MKNKDAVNINLGGNNNNNTNQILFSTQNHSQHEKNLKINAIIRQKKNLSVNIDYPNYTKKLTTVCQVNTSNSKSNLIQGKNPFVTIKINKNLDDIYTLKNNKNIPTNSQRKMILTKSKKPNPIQKSSQILNKENLDINLPLLEDNYNIEHFSNIEGTYSTSLTDVNSYGGTSSKQSHLLFEKENINQNFDNLITEEENFDEDKENKNIILLNNKKKCTQEKIKENNILFELSQFNHQLKLDNFLKKDDYLKIPHHLKEYLEDIYISLKMEEIECKFKINPNYFQFQTEINDQMRAILIDWLIEVHLKFNLRDETLFITVLIIDKYLSQKAILRSKLQLLGVAALMIGCKQEEILIPNVRDFVYITDQAYTKEEVLVMEKEILDTLDFNILHPSCLRFYEIIAQFFKFDKKQFMFGRYLMEIYLLDSRINKYNMSLVACTSAYITMKFFNFTNYQAIYGNFFLSNGNPNMMKDCAKEIINLLDNIERSSLNAVKRKFARKEFCQVSMIKY